ncbi:TPA: tetratricopeptide repeat protein [bacterium]|nr:tetratricopeptide repeat protein [bacterium]
MKLYFIAIGLSLFVSTILMANDDYYSPEHIYRFAEYLYQEKDYTRSAKEYERYISVTQDKNDIALYRLGLCYRNVRDTNKAIKTFQELIDKYNTLNFPASYQIGYSYLIANQYQDSINYINKILSEIQNTDEKSKLYILLAYNYLNKRQWNQAIKSLDMIPQTDNDQINSLACNIREQSLKGVNLRYKNRIFASIASAIIPGAGKIYCKQYGNGIYSFVTIASTGLIAWRGFDNDGISSIKGWIFGSLCAVFYAGNIYGSGISALAYNRQMEDEILIRLPLLPSEW